MDDVFSKDLFGGVTRITSGRRGRPAHKWSQEAENAVIMGCALGWNNERIASSLGVSVPTLRKHYFSALKAKDIARDRYEIWKATKLQSLADDGNVSAYRELEKLMQKMDRARLNAEIDDAQNVKPVAKKAAARKAANETVASDWDGMLQPGVYQN